MRRCDASSPSTRTIPNILRDLYAHTLALHPELEHILDIIDEDDRRIFGVAS